MQGEHGEKREGTGGESGGAEARRARWQTAALWVIAGLLALALFG